MSDTLPYTIWEKLRYTPMRDFLRGRLTARMDLRRPFEQAAVPAAVKDLVYRVVKSTRLWRLEQLEVAQELLAHFADGIASGASAESLIQQFGDEQQAATLIRRAKRRNRSLPWQFMRIAGWPAAAVLLVYFGFAASFLSRTPSPRVNYVANINKEIERVPLEDRAWPLYRRALLGLGGGRRESFVERRVGEEESPGFLEIVRTHPEELEWLREGAAKPAFGFLFGATGSAFDAELWPDQKPPQVDPDTGEDLAGAAIPSLRMLGDLASVLRADASLAREEHDGKRLLRDIHSILGLSRQLGRDGPLLLGVSSFSIYETALGQVERTLREDPSLLSDEEWRGISRRLSSEKVAADLFTLDMERMWFSDMLQRSFTDDGMGNGRLTLEGARYFDPRPRGSGPALRQWTVDPLIAMLAPTREELAKDYNQVLDRASSNLTLPLRDADWQEVRAALDTSPRSVFASPMVIGNFTPTFWKLQEGAERHLGRRDGVVVGIALEAYRRRHSRYPDDLNALVPQFLTEVPADRISGAAVRYRLENNRPVVYSVGGDRDDDGGRAAEGPETAANWGLYADRAISDGDWVLYPSAR